MQNLVKCLKAESLTCASQHWVIALKPTSSACGNLFANFMPHYKT
jgi:hypothetical protein